MLMANGYPLFTSGIREAKAFKTAALRGCVVNEIKGPRAAVCWEDYVNVGAELMR